MIRNHTSNAKSQSRKEFLDKKTLRPLYLCVFALMALLVMLPATAKVETHEFADPQTENDYKQLINELRCLVCQNQNLADSNAELAQDLRQQVFEMLNKGQSREQIVDYMVTRYGDFVMYKPPVKSTTMLLWFGPLVFLLIAASVVFVFMRKQKKTVSVVSTQQQKQVHKLLDE